MQNQHSRTTFVSNSELEQLVSLCDTYAKSFQGDSIESAVDLLRKVEPENRATLLRNLLQIQNDALQLPKSKIDRTKITHAFPELAEVFKELTEDAVSHDPLKNESDFNSLKWIGKYRLVRLLGKGGMGAVFEAIHSKDKSRVALKVLPKVDGNRLHLFKKEFRSVAQVNHPNLVGLHRLESDGTFWFFTMDLIDGVDFLSYVRPKGELNVSRLQNSLPQLVRAVTALHDKNILHRDLKPSNVMVTTDDRVILLDFGLVFDLQQDQQVPGEFAGTPAYMALEQLTDATLSNATDWYSVGIMLYEALSGERPFKGSFQEMLRAKKAWSIRPVYNDSVPKEVVLMVPELLNPNPEMRPNLAQIRKTLALQEETIFQCQSAKANLVGRNRQIEALTNFYEDYLDTKKHSVVFVKGRSGEGKTSLAESFLTSLREGTDVQVYSGRCYDRESVPYKAIDPLIDSISLSLLNRGENAIAELIPEGIEFLAHLFPTLQRVPQIRKQVLRELAARDAREIRVRAFSAFRSLLKNLSHRSPVVLFIDDLQWGDSDSAEILLDNFIGDDPALIFLIGTYRSDQKDHSDFLNRWMQLVAERSPEFSNIEVAVGVLSDEEIIVLIDQYFPNESSEAKAKTFALAKEAGSNPYLLTELLTYLRSHSGSLSSFSLQGLIKHKLRSLPQDAEQLLKIVAVSGQAIDIDELTELNNLGITPVSTISRMQSESLLRDMSGKRKATIDTYHDRIREIVLENMDLDERKSLHRRFGMMIEQKIGGFPSEQLDNWLDRRDSILDEEQEFTNIPRVFDLSYHFDHAGDQTRASRYSFLAAQQAKSQYALEVAAQQFSTFRKNSQSVDSSLKYAAGEDESHTLMRQAKFEEAEAKVIETMKHARDEIQRARLSVVRSELLFESGAIKRSAKVAAQQLERLGFRIARRRWKLVLLSIVGWSQHLARATLMPERWYRNLETMDAKTYVTVELLKRLCYINFYTNTLAFVWVITPMILRVERYKYNWLQGEMYSILSVMYVNMGFKKLAEHRCQVALDYFTRQNNLRGIGSAKLGFGVKSLCAGELNSAAELLHDSIECLKQTGDSWKIDCARYCYAMSRLKMGDVELAIYQAQEILETQYAVGNRSLMSDGIVILARATDGNFPFPSLEILRGSAFEDDQAVSKSAEARLLWCMSHNELFSAKETAETALSIVSIFKAEGITTLSSLPVIARYFRRLADARESTSPREKKRCLIRSLRVIKSAVKKSRRFPFEKSVCLREYAETLLAMGKHKRAQKAAQKSRQIALEQGANFEIAHSDLCLAKIGVQLGDLNAQSEFDTAQEKIQQFQSRAQEAVKKSKFFDVEKHFPITKSS